MSNWTDDFICGLCGRKPIWARTWKQAAKKWRAYSLWWQDQRAIEGAAHTGTRRRELAAEALAASRLELARVVNRHRKDRMHSDMKLAWDMAQKILEEAKELGE